jgi:hypothetical protein
MDVRSSLFRLTAILLVWGLLPNAYAYYMLLRVVVFGVCVYASYECRNLRRDKLTWLFGGVAILYNPFLPLYFTRAIWFPIDVLVAVLLLSVRFQNIGVPPERKPR